MSKLLIVGSEVEALLAIKHFESCATVEKLYHLPTETGPEPVFCAESYELPGSSLPRVCELLDTWGKQVLHLDLPSLIKPSGEVAGKKREVFARGLKVSRTTITDDGVCATFSDGSEVLCDGVVFADGWQSQCRAFWNKPMKKPSDPDEVQCWRFTIPNVLSLRSYQFRWAAAKSVELMPLSGEELSVALRFKSPYGGDLSVAELRELFGEFGSDMTALLENPDEISYHQETKAGWGVFIPAPGCYAIGRAALPTRSLWAFDWLSRFTVAQLGVLCEQLEAGSLNGPSFEAQSSESLTEFANAESFLRHHLHSEGVFLRLARSVLLKLLPASLWKNALRKRLLAHHGKS
ncbi:MAG TPA: hypothetical protein EYO33_07865 [Phycisphaerales bacterium]|nr:hypothetical protein [Phycisphaerales bacterium]